VVIFSKVDSGKPTSKAYYGGPHFLARPCALAFGEFGVMATVHDTDELTQGKRTPKDFMGPTLHPTDLTIFNAGGKSHLDMLHNSPLAGGVAWEHKRVFWVFDGYHNSITSYDFAKDHKPGGTDHSDGIIRRYVQGKVKRVKDVASHMVMDAAAHLLYIADTGNNRIAVLDTATGTLGSSFGPNYDKSSQKKVNGATIKTLVDGGKYKMKQPAGIAIFADILFVTDSATSKILAFSKSNGDLFDWLDTGLPPGSLMGIDIDEKGRIYLVDAVAHRVLRISAKSP
jgi:sugar lactone lactonase YvrE